MRRASTYLATALGPLTPRPACAQFGPPPSTRHLIVVDDTFRRSRAAVVGCTARVRWRHRHGSSSSSSSSRQCRPFQRRRRQQLWRVGGFGGGSKMATTTTSLALPPPRLRAGSRGVHPRGGAALGARHSPAMRTRPPLRARAAPRRLFRSRAATAASPPPLLRLLAGTRRGEDQGFHRAGGARAAPRRPGLVYRRGKTVRVKPTRARKAQVAPGAKKRYQLADGTFMHHAAGKRHLMAGASRRRQTYRLLAHRPIKTKGDTKKLNRLLPHGTTMMRTHRYKNPLMWERPDGWTERVLASKQPPPSGAAADAGGKSTKAKKKP